MIMIGGSLRILWLMRLILSGAAGRRDAGETQVV